jgi:phage shock protein A
MSLSLAQRQEIRERLAALLTEARALDERLNRAGRTVERCAERARRATSRHP